MFSVVFVVLRNKPKASCMHQADILPLGQIRSPPTPRILRCGSRKECYRKAKVKATRPPAETHQLCCVLLYWADDSYSCEPHSDSVHSLALVLCLAVALPFRAPVPGRRCKSLDANHPVGCERSTVVRVGLGAARGARAPESHLHRHASQWSV